MRYRSVFLAFVAALLLAACRTPVPPAPEAPPPSPQVTAPHLREPVKIALVLGGGAARGFAHIGVIKALEAQGITPDIVVGTSAGSVVGALYAAGYNGFDMQTLAMQMEEKQVSDWSLPNRGVIKGEALQDFINNAVKERPLEKLNKLFAVVATDLKSGEMIVFRTGNTGMAVRASSSVPGVFQPVTINGREYVDGGLVAPIPVSVAKNLGADFIIAVDISASPENHKTDSTLEVLLQTFNIMEQRINRNELPQADIVIHPATVGMDTTDFNTRNQAVLEGEKAAAAIMPELKAKLVKLNAGRSHVVK
jgi:NTE family protein